MAFPAKRGSIVQGSAGFCTGPKKEAAPCNRKPIFVREQIKGQRVLS